MSSPAADLKVLIVDDNPLNLRLASVTLKVAGFEVRTADGAEEALRVIPDFQPRVILMDLQMPGIDGLTLTRGLKADPATADIAIVATTSYAMTGDRERALEAGCDGYVSKPIDTRTFADTIRGFGVHA